MKSLTRLLVAPLLCFISFAAIAQTVLPGTREPNMTAITIFLAFVVNTIGINY